MMKIFVILFFTFSTTINAQTKLLYTQTGSPERLSRILVNHLEKTTKQTIMAELAVGGGVAIAVNRFKESSNNLLLVNDAFFIGVIEGLYDIKQFQPISFMGETPLVITVRSDSKLTCNNLKNDALFYGTPTKGTVGHYTGVVFNRLNPKITIVEYKVASNFIVDLLGGRIETVILHPGSLNDSMRGLVNTGSVEWFGVPSWKDCLKTNQNITNNYFIFGHNANLKLNEQINSFFETEDAQNFYNREKYKVVKMDVKTTESYMNKILSNWKSIISN